MTALASGTSHRFAMWAASARASTMPRNGPMLAGIFEFAPSSAIT